MKKRDFKHEYELQKKRGDVEGFLERQKARRMYDKKKIDRKGNLRLRNRSANKSDNK